jgi:hypothetical protein
VGTGGDQHVVTEAFDGDDVEASLLADGGDPDVADR